MAIYSSGIETKRRFILLTHQKLTQSSASDLSVRELSAESGYSSSALYRHFESLEYLIIVSSVRFLDEYMAEYAKIWDGEGDMDTYYLAGWKLFNHYAFARPDIYYRLFWGQYNQQFTNAVQEYYDLFPFSGAKRYPNYFHSLLFNDNITKRDLLVLQQLSARGLVSEEKAAYLGRTTSLIVKGILHEALELPPEGRLQAEEECNRILEQSLKFIL